MCLHHGSTILCLPELRHLRLLLLLLLLRSRALYSLLLLLPCFLVVAIAKQRRPGTGHEIRVLLPNLRPPLLL